MKDARLIERFGTADELAEAVFAKTGVKVTRSAVYEWKRNGIPKRWRQTVSALAKSLPANGPDRKQDAA